MPEDESLFNMHLLPGFRFISTGSVGKRTPLSGLRTFYRCWRKRWRREAWGISSPINSTWLDGIRVTYVCESVINLLHPQTKVHNSSLMSFHLKLSGGFFSLPPQATHVMVHFDKDTDVVTGLKQKTHYGRPIWDKEFEQVRKENPT